MYLLKRLSALFALFIVSTSLLPAQLKYWEESFNGGVVTGGWSLGVNASGTGNFSVSIPAGSTIRRAYFIATCLGPTPAATVTLNGVNYALNNTNIVTSGFNSMYGGLSEVHVIDATANISPAVSNYTLVCPTTGGVTNKWVEFYLFIAFDNPALPTMTAGIWLNTIDFAGTMPWTLNVNTPITTAAPVGLAVLGGYAANSSTDCEQVNVNGTLLGDWRGGDFNTTSGYGAMGSFQYYNNTLTGYGDDNANQAIAGTDVLSNIAAVIPNNTTSVPVTFIHCPGGSDMDNHSWAVFMAWSGGVVLPARPTEIQGSRLPNGQVQIDGAFVYEGGEVKCVLERSLDGRAFAAVAAPRDLEKTSMEQVLQWMDAEAPVTPLVYRVKLVDADGQYQYSHPVEVGPAEAGAFVLRSWPNPVREGGQVQAELYGSGKLEVRVYEVGSGRLLASQGFSLEGEMVHAVNVETEGWGSGLRVVEYRLNGAVKREMVRVE